MIIISVLRGLDIHKKVIEIIFERRISKVLIDIRRNEIIIGLIHKWILVLMLIHEIRLTLIEEILVRLGIEWARWDTRLIHELIALGSIITITHKLIVLVIKNG